MIFLGNMGMFARGVDVCVLGEGVGLRESFIYFLIECIEIIYSPSLTIILILNLILTLTIMLYFRNNG